MNLTDCYVTIHWMDIDDKLNRFKFIRNPSCLYHLCNLSFIYVLFGDNFDLAINSK